MKTFQKLISALNDYWQEYGCTIMQPYTTEVGAGTLHPITALRAVDCFHYKIAYTQPSIRPADGRYGQSPNRLYQHHQYQVILKPSPDNIQQLYLDSLNAIGVNIKENDISFIPDDWENPSIGACGTGWEIWCNGMEISQFTYMQQVGGIECEYILGELTYGLERIAMFLQNKKNVYDLKWSDSLTYGELFKKQEEDFSAMVFLYNDHEELLRQFKETEEKAILLIKKQLPLAAYDQCLKASHIFNLLDANGGIGTEERTYFILKTREISNQCCLLWHKFQREKKEVTNIYE